MRPLLHAPATAAPGAAMGAFGTLVGAGGVFPPVPIGVVGGPGSRA